MKKQAKITDEQIDEQMKGLKASDDEEGTDGLNVEKVREEVAKHLELKEEFSGLKEQQSKIEQALENNKRDRDDRELLAQMFERHFSAQRDKDYELERLQSDLDKSKEELAIYSKSYKDTLAEKNRQISKKDEELSLAMKEIGVYKGEEKALSNEDKLKVEEGMLRAKLSQAQKSLSDSEYQNKKLQEELEVSKSELSSASATIVELTRPQVEAFQSVSRFTQAVPAELRGVKPLQKDGAQPAASTALDAAKDVYGPAAGADPKDVRGPTAVADADKTMLGFQTVLMPANKMSGLIPFKRDADFKTNLDNAIKNEKKKYMELLEYSTNLHYNIINAHRDASYDVANDKSLSANPSMLAKLTSVLKLYKDLVQLKADSKSKNKETRNQSAAKTSAVLWDYTTQFKELSSMTFTDTTDTFEVYMRKYQKAISKQSKIVNDNLVALPQIYNTCKSQLEILINNIAYLGQLRDRHDEIEVTPAMLSLAFSTQARSFKSLSSLPMDTKKYELIVKGLKEEAGKNLSDRINQLRAEEGRKKKSYESAQRVLANAGKSVEDGVEDLVETAQQRVDETKRELDTAKANLNDIVFFDEISQSLRGLNDKMEEQIIEELGKKTQGVNNNPLVCIANILEDEEKSQSEQKISNKIRALGSRLVSGFTFIVSRCASPFAFVSRMIWKGIKRVIIGKQTEHVSQKLSFELEKEFLLSNL